MKGTSIFKIALVALPLIAASCGSSKKLAETTSPAITPDSLVETGRVLQQVMDNNQTTEYITSKLKFDVEVGSQQLSLTGNLRMKRNDVIRLQLMAFGFVEAGRLEFTEDYVLIMDRINKQFLKASYDDVGFLRNSGLNFYSIQALFWNELFHPGETEVGVEQYANYTTDAQGDTVTISLERDKLLYTWKTQRDGGRIDGTDIAYTDKYRGNTQLIWQYSDFREVEDSESEFPATHNIVFTTPSKEIKMAMTLNYIKHDTDWETRTEVSSKYKEVDVDDILRRFMAL